jgi:hypothetical protein
MTQLYELMELEMEGQAMILAMHKVPLGRMSYHLWAHTQR